MGDPDQGPPEPRSREGPPLILASSSPRRAEILELLGLDFRVRPSSLAETVLAGEGPRDHVERLAREKAGEVAASHGDSLVLAGDTVVTLEGEVLGKPADPADARRMLAGLSGREHEVLTAMALAAPSRPTDVRLASARVTFRHLSPDEIDGYVATGEPLDKAGGYGIQGLGSALVASISGDYYAVVGLSVAALLELLEAAGRPYRFGAAGREIP